MKLWATDSGEGFNERGKFPKTNYLNKGGLRPKSKMKRNARDAGDSGTGSTTANA